jgi:hypothetical protein
LYLLTEGHHIGREPARDEQIDVELLGARMLLGLVQATLEILHILRTLGNDLIIHRVCRLPDGVKGRDSSMQIEVLGGDSAGPVGQRREVLSVAGAFCGCA